MSKKKLLILMLSIFVMILVGGIGKTETTSGASGTGEASAQLNKRYTFMDVEAAKTVEEKRKLLLAIIKSQPESEEGWAIDENNQDKRDAVFEFMGMNPTEEEVKEVVDQIEIQKSWVAKKDLMDALSNSRYKDIIAKGYKKIAETDEDLFIRGLAASKLIDLGFEEEGFKYSLDVIEKMNEENTLVDFFDPFSRMKDKEKAKHYLEQLRNDKSKNDYIKSYAVLMCYATYRSSLAPYYHLLEDTVLRKDINQITAKYIISNLAGMSTMDKKLFEILEKAEESGNADVRKIAAMKIKRIKKRMK